MSYLDIYDDRQRKQIEWSRLYASEFNHGDDGHNAKLIIAFLSWQLESVENSAGCLLDMVKREEVGAEAADHIKTIAGILNIPVE